MNRSPATRPAPAAARQSSLREHNLALVARAVFDAATPCSRADVAAASGLTRATVSTLVDQLVGARIVAELPPAAPQRAGRPAVPLAPARRTVLGLGLEVNVDHLGARLLDLAGDVVAERVEPGDFHDSAPAGVLGRLGAIARDLAAAATADGMQVAGARLALPGLVDVRAGRLEVAPNLGWTRLDPAPYLTLDLPVTVANEAKLAALAQVGSGVGSDAGVPATYLYVSGDVGIGSAIVLDGRIFQGGHGWAGEVGHVVVDPNGPRCRCGATGCLEQYAGKDALLRAAGLETRADAPDLVALLEDGDARARRSVARAGHALGSALADYINLVDVHTVLLGGIYPALLPYLREGIETSLRARVLAAPWANLQVVAAPVADHAALTGGAREVLRGVLEDPSPWVRA